jgi:hypothetical protein
MEDPQLSATTIQNLVAWSPGYIRRTHNYQPPPYKIYLPGGLVPRIHKEDPQLSATTVQNLVTWYLGYIWRTHNYQPPPYKI